MAVVGLERLTKRYPGAAEAAVHEVSLRVEDGEFVVLLGPSGCGKSTLLRMVAGLEPITSGVLTIDGRVMNQLPARDRDIAMVFQSYALYPHMDVEANLAFGLRRRGVPRDEVARRVAAVSATLGLDRLLGRKPYALSGGQRQRVALGRAIVRDPKVFLFDEPLSNLDAALRVSMRNELIKLHHRLGATMLYVTHDQVEAMTMGTRIGIMQAGQMVQVGPPLEVYRRPVNTFVAAFLGNPPMNLLPAAVTGDGGRPAVRLGEATLPLPDGVGSPAGPVILGVRPEDLAEGPRPGGATLRAEVVAVEPLGAETLLVLRLPGVDQDVTARVGRDARARRGEVAAVSLDPAALHLFDPRTTLALA
jgi:multiple sugar transport system ATP-binding protein